MDENSWNSFCFMEPIECGTMKGHKCANDMLTGGTHNNFAEQNNPHGVNIGFAEEIFLQLGMSDQKIQKWNRNMDNLETKEASHSHYRFDCISPLDTSSISNTKDELSFVTETISASSELSQDDMNSNDYQEGKRNANRGSSLLCLNGFEEFSHNLDLSSFSETFSCDSDTEESIMKDEIFSSDKQTGNGAGDEKSSNPKEDEPKTGLVEHNAVGTENSQMQLQHDTVAKQLDHVKALMQANQLLTEALRTKLLQIWCHMPKNEVERFQDDNISECDTESLLVFPGEDSSVASVYEDNQNLVTEQQSNLLKIPVENAQCERTNRHSEIHHSLGDVNCLSDHVQTVKPQEENRYLDEKVSDLEKDAEQQNEVLRNQVTSLKCDNSETEYVDKNTSKKEQLAINLKNLENATKDMQEYNQKMMLAKDTIEDTAETVKIKLEKIQWQLTEIENANRNLHLQIRKLNADYSQIQEHHQCMVCENKSLADQCVDLQTNLNSTAAENEQMLTVIAKLEKKIEAALVNLAEIKTEKNKLEQQVQSLKDEYNIQEEVRNVEREQIIKNYSKLVDEVENLRVQSEREHIDTQNLKHEIAAVRNENLRLQEVTKEEIKEKKSAELDARRWKKEFHKLAAEQQEKESQTNIVVQMLKTEMNELKDTSKKKEKEVKHNMKMLTNIILDMKLVHTDLSTKRPADKGDCVNSVCVKRTSQILSKLDVILSSMEGIIVCRESNNCSNGMPPGGDTGNKGITDLKEIVLAVNNKGQHSKQEECAANDSKLRESLGNSTSSHKSSKNETVHKRIVKKNEECKLLAAENVKLHKCVKELACKVNGFNKIIQFADQRLQMNNLHILRLEKKNSILLAALNKKPRKNELRESSSPESTSGSSKASGMAYRSRAERSNHNEPDVCYAKGAIQHLKMCNKQNQKQSQEVDSLESKEGIRSRYHFGSISQPDVYSICNKKDELCLETEMIGTPSEISQDVNTHKPIRVEGNKYREGYHQMKADTSCKQKLDQAAKTKYHRAKSSDEFKLLATENIRLHTSVNELQYKVDGLNKIVQFADQRLRMFNLQIMRTGANITGSR
uniref:cancer-associated gene 1 protein homolog n=1 Tax=Pristiophorus japonicus TaxID=55135 RepID=UPI00398EA269